MFVFPSNRWIKFALYFAVLITVASMGFYIIGMNDPLNNWTFIDSIYMTIITLSTVGFSETHPLSETGKLWAIVVIIFGASGFAVLLSEFGTEMMEMKTYRRKKMEKKISKLKKHYIICGFGRMGAIIADELHNKGVPYVIVELNEQKIKQIEEKKYFYLEGDATLDETIISAGIKEAKGIVVVLDNDQDNLFVTMSARNLNQEAYIISRCALHDTGKKLKRAGADKVVNPYITGGHRMAELLISPYVEDSVTIDTPEQPSIDMAIEEINLKYIPGIQNKTIKDCKLREKYELMIVGIIEETGGIILNPGSHIQLNSNQKIMIIGSKTNLSRFKEDIRK